MIMEELYIDKAKFDAVWSRVTNNAPGNREMADSRRRAKSATLPDCTAADYCQGRDTQDNEEAELIELMDMTALNAKYCRAIAQKCPGRMSAALSCIAREERRHLKKLRAEYFIMTGCVYCPEDVRVSVCTVSGTLRTVCRNLSVCAQKYAQYANNAQPQLKLTYQQFAQDEMKNAETVSCLIEGMLC